MEILIQVCADPVIDDGTTIRAKRVFRLLEDQFEVSLSGYYRFRCTMPKVKFLLLFPYWLFKLVRALLKSRSGIVYLCHDRYGFLVAKALQFIGKYQIIYEAHAVVSEEYRNRGELARKVRFMHSLEGFVARHSNYVVALSENTLEFFKRYTPNVELIPVFVDTDRYKLDRETRTRMRRQYEINDVLVGLVGPFTLSSNKHYLTFLYNNLARFDERIKFMIVGDCLRREESAKLIYTGYVADYIDHISCLDCVLIPSKIPTGGPLNKIVEAMSLGLPVFTTPQGMVGLYQSSIRS
jgi:glycosyltransferase involved in cell wall biosynthesis